MEVYLTQDDKPPSPSELPDPDGLQIRCGILTKRTSLGHEPGPVLFVRMHFSWSTLVILAAIVLAIAVVIAGLARAQPVQPGPEPAPYDRA